MENICVEIIKQFNRTNWVFSTKWGFEQVRPCRLRLNFFISDSIRRLDNFVFDEQTGASYSCSALLNGRMLIIGGDEDFTSQISEVKNCKLQKTGHRMPTKFYNPACNSFMDENQSQYVLLCFGYDNNLDVSTSQCYM